MAQEQEEGTAVSVSAPDRNAPVTCAPSEEVEMEIHKPKPWHGWRGFLKEYAIIVAGVLTALVGEELVIAAHHHSEVADLRSALHSELAWNFVALKDAADDLPCVEQRMKEAEAWAASLQGGAEHQLKIKIQRPTYVLFRSSTWRSASAGTLDNVPLDERVAYAQFYDSVENNDRIRSDARLAWRDLEDFGDTHTASGQELRQISHDIRIIRTSYRTLALNYENFKNVYAPATGVRIEEAPARGNMSKAAQAARLAMCKPSIANL